jgi:PAS domain S-box-containing protein
MGFMSLTKSDDEKDSFKIHFFKSAGLLKRDFGRIGPALKQDLEAQEALGLARDTGKVAVSGKLLSLFATFDDPALIMALPIYRREAKIDTVEEKRAALSGYVLAAFRAEEFFNGIVDRGWTERKKIGYAIVDQPVVAAKFPAKESVLYSDLLPAQTQTANSTGHHRSFELKTGARPLTLSVRALPGFDSGFQLALPYLIFATGAALTLFAFRMLILNQRQSFDLLKSERQLRIVTDSSPALIAYVDPEEKFRFANKAFETWFQLQSEEMIGKTLREFSGLFAYAETAGYAQRALQGETVTYETVIRKPGGKPRPVRANYIPDIGPHGRVKGFIALVTDMTDTKLATERNRFLAELSAILSSSLNVETTLSEFANLLLPTGADWCLLDLVTERGIIRSQVAARGENRQHLLALLGQGSSFEADPSHLGASVIRAGEPLLVTAPTPEVFLPENLRNESSLEAIGELGHASAIFLPLKARHRILGSLTLVRSQAADAFTSDDLAFAMDVARRAALAIENSLLYSEAQRANHAKDEFLATLSHELRTPMNVILGWLEILASEDFEQEEFQQVLSTLNRNANLQLQLINDLLDISRIISGKISLELAPVDLASIADEAVEGFVPVARAKNIKLTKSIDTLETPVVRGDHNRINQIIWNLLSNALKFTPNGGTIHVEMKANENEYSISVRDSGRGIDPLFLPFIFDRFRQEESGSTRAQGGLGLGLSIVRYLMELHGGSIEAHSAGRGFGASFTLKFARAVAVDTPSAHAPEPMTNQMRSLNGVKILLLDDSEDVRALITRVLTKAGAEVTSAKRSHDAEILIRNQQFDVFVSDIGLPEEDGIQFIKRYRRMETAQGLKPLPSVALSAYAHEDNVKEALEAGFNRHLPKPVTAADLLETVAWLAFGKPKTPSSPVREVSL